MLLEAPLSPKTMRLIGFLKHHKVIVLIDMVLGIQWLQLLGPILWDFATLTMEFNYGGLKCLLKGLQMRAEWCLENADTFKVSQQNNK
jgi:hypothetical protein